MIQIYMIKSEVKLIGGVFHCGHFDVNEISFRVIKYHVNYESQSILKFTVNSQRIKLTIADKFTKP